MKRTHKYIVSYEKNGEVFTLTLDNKETVVDAVMRFVDISRKVTIRRILNTENET